MTIYIKNNTNKDIKFPFEDEIYIFKANNISYVDENKLSYSRLERAYGYKNLYKIENPTIEQINSAISALQISEILPPEIEDIITDETSGDRNAIRKKYSLLQQTLGSIILDQSIVLSSGTGTGNKTLIVPESTKFIIQNVGGESLSFTINELTITLASLSAFEDNFTPFTQVDIITTSTYNWYTK